MVNNEENEQDAPQATVKETPPPSLSTILSALPPIFSYLMKERFSAETRSAQNKTILLAAMGIALSSGLITLPTGDECKSNLTVFGFNFVTSAKVASILLAVSSIFLLVRFLFLSWRDLVIYEYESQSARDTLRAFVDLSHEESVELAKRAKEQQEQIDNGTVVDWEEFQKEQEALKKEFETHHRVVEPASVFVTRYESLKKLITSFERGLPFALVIILLGVVSFKFVRM
jgi:hypothetical protein